MSLVESIPDTVVGNKLKLARTAAAFTLTDASGSVGLSVSTISEIEHGKRRVSGVELFKFSQLYDRPLNFFLEKPKSNAAFSLLFRSADKVAVPTKTILDFYELCRNYRDLEKLTSAPRLPTSPDYSAAHLSTLDQAEHLAEAERRRLGLDSEPIKEICDLLEQKSGIKIFHLPEAPDGLSGAFAYDEEWGSCFLINSRHPKGRRTFTIAHEYAHCITHRDKSAYIDTSVTFEAKAGDDRFANAFAASFLMPRRTVSEMFNQLVSHERRHLTLEGLTHTAMYFGVSTQAMGWRLVSMRKVSRPNWQQFLAESVAPSPVARLLGYNEEEDLPDMLPRRYRYLAYKAYEGQLISFEKLAEFLRENYYDLKEKFSESIKGT